MAAPEILFGYEVLARIGAGAESSIYRAREVSSGRIVALKHVIAENRENLKYLRHVRNEYQILQSLLSENRFEPPHGIVKVFKLLKTGLLRRRKEHLLVMEYVEGLDLKKERRYPMGQMIHILIGISNALSALHTRGLIHGDMKPENVIVSSGGNPTLVDFGFSCRAGTEASSIRGTRDYMAPEQVDRGMLTEKTDLYNFGAMMYFIFSGRHVPALIAAPGDSSLFIGSRKQVAPDIRTFNPLIPESLDKMILRCVEKDVSARPTCVEEVRDVLKDVGRRFSDGRLL